MQELLEKPEKLTLLAPDEYKSVRGMTQTEYAKHRGVSRQAVFRHKMAGRLVCTERGFINVAASDEALKAVLDPAFTARPEASNDKINLKRTSFDKSKAKEKQYQAALLELDYLAKNKKLVSAKGVEKAAYELGRKFRDEMLRVPQRVISQLLSAFEIDVSLDNLKKGQDIMAGEIKKSLQGF